MLRKQSNEGNEGNINICMTDIQDCFKGKLCPYMHAYSLQTAHQVSGI